MKKQFYVAYYGNKLVAQILGPVGLSVSDIIREMKKSVAFSHLKDEGYSESAIEKMIAWSEIKIYQLGE